jgi:hypothetical protein
MVFTKNSACKKHTFFYYVSLVLIYFTTLAGRIIFDLSGTPLQYMFTRDLFIKTIFRNIEWLLPFWAF